MKTYVMDLLFEGDKVGKVTIDENFDMEHLNLIEAILIEPEYRKLQQHEKEMLLNKKLSLIDIQYDISTKFTEYLCVDYISIVGQLYSLGARFARGERVYESDLSYFMDRFNRYEMRDIVN